MFVHTKDSGNTRTAYLWFNGRIQQSWLSAFTIFLAMLQTFRTPHSALESTGYPPASMPCPPGKATCCFHQPCCPFNVCFCSLPPKSLFQWLHLVVQKCVHGVLSLLHESTLCLQTVYLTVSLLILDFPVYDTGQAVQNLATYICSLSEQMLLILLKKSLWHLLNIQIGYHKVSVLPKLLYHF